MLLIVEDKSNSTFSRPDNDYSKSETTGGNNISHSANQRDIHKHESQYGKKRPQTGYASRLFNPNKKNNNPYAIEIFLIIYV